MNLSQKELLLEDLSEIAEGYGIAELESNNEADFLKNFLPITQYKQLFEPDNFLILGGRGAGKTELFNLFRIPTARKNLYTHTKSRAFKDLSQTEWLVAFGHHSYLHKRPASDVIERSIKNKEANWQAFWVGLLTSMILSSDYYKTSDIPISASIKSVLTKELSRPSLWLPLVNENYEDISLFLDDIDNELVQKNKWLFFMYDELDKIINSYDELAKPIRILLSYWLERTRRWNRLRPKIFLRNDLFREDFLGFPDASKLRPHLIRLEWSITDLYQLLTKRLANKSEAWRSYLLDNANVRLSKEEIFGDIPLNNDISTYENIMSAIVGKFMGADSRKGKTYTWIPNHLQDGDRKIAPRSFLKLFVIAAENRLSSKAGISSLNDSHLLLPQDLQSALQETSQDRIRELADEEYPWLNALQKQLKDMEVPAEKAKFIEAIGNTVWSDNTSPPTKEPKKLLQYLEDLGIIEVRLDGRINVPEIYLYGFGMKRRGGVKRAK